MTDLQFDLHGFGDLLLPTHVTAAGPRHASLGRDATTVPGMPGSRQTSQGWLEQTICLRNLAARAAEQPQSEDICCAPSHAETSYTAPAEAHDVLVIAMPSHITHRRAQDAIWRAEGGHEPGIRR